MQFGPGHFITLIPSWSLFLLILALSLISAKAGQRFAIYRNARGLRESEKLISSTTGAILGLTSFMLGFTFSFTQARYGERKKLVVEEANAITKSYLRTSLLPGKQKKAFRILLHEYVDILTKHDNPDEFKKNIERLETLHILLWQEGSSLKDESTLPPALVTFYLTGLNDLIDVYSKRKSMGLINKIPDVIWTSLILISVMGSFILGYQSDDNSKRLLGITLLSSATAIVMVMISEMDSAGKGRIQVNQQPLQEVSVKIKKLDMLPGF